MTTDAKPRTQKRGANSSLTQVAVVLLLVLGLSVIFDFNRRIQAEQRIVAESKQLGREVTALAATQSALATELAYASSDAYVAQWAHSDGKLIQPGEALVVPVAPGGTAPTPTPAPAPAPTSQSKLHIWWTLFFDSGS